MADPFSFYISAAADLMAERELLGKAIAEIPVDLGWRITVSPGKNDPLDLDLISHADFHLLMLGSDIRAPVGHEYQHAMLNRRNPATFLKANLKRTLAADEFKRYVNYFNQWQLFESGNDLLQAVLPLIIDLVFDKAHAFKLTPVEIDNLNRLRKDPIGHISIINDEVRGGTGESSQILSLDRFLPSEGILLGSDEESSN